MLLPFITPETKLYYTITFNNVQLLEFFKTVCFRNWIWFCHEE
jgi:hypothetical protein